jgi:hypothetical protein
VFIAVAASISGFGNHWAQDDFAVIWKNPKMHDLGRVWRFFAEPYWPPPFSPDLYRPLSSTSFALQWAASGGTPPLFRLVSYGLYAWSAVAVFVLARRLLPFAVAFGVAVLFAAHPVHVEAVAMAVNQAEVWVGILACVITVRYLRIRSRPGPLAGRDIASLAGLYLLACLFKETALVVPGLLLAAELLLVRRSEPAGIRVAALRLPYLVLALVGTVFLGVRTLALSGDPVGSFTAEGLAGLSMGQRALTMLSVVPEWLRLLVWPVHLQGDYSPRELEAALAWGGNQTLGALVLVAVLAIAVAAWRRAPLITFGIIWIAIALFPVSNVLVPTGIVMAERTLFLPSVGFLLALGGAAAPLLARADERARLGLAAIVGALAILGVYRSTTRHPVWQDQFTFWHTTATKDAPLSYRARHALAELLYLAGAEGEAEPEYRTAIALYPRITSVFMDYANKLRLKGHCYPAMELYRRALALQPSNIAARISLMACLMEHGSYREAIAHARMGISFDYRPNTFRRWLATADSALRVGAPPGTVKLTLLPVDSLDPGLQTAPVVLQ